VEVDLGFMNFSEKLLSFAFVKNKSPKIAPINLKNPQSFIG
jgi:hypothetical protein